MVFDCQVPKVGPCEYLNTSIQTFGRFRCHLELLQLKYIGDLISKRLLVYYSDAQKLSNIQMAAQ